MGHAEDEKDQVEALQRLLDEAPQTQREAWLREARLWYWIHQQLAEASEDEGGATSSR
jgi:hypothetical protein